MIDTYVKLGLVGKIKREKYLDKDVHLLFELVFLKLNGHPNLQ